MFVSKNERLPGFFRPGTPARHRLSASGVYSKRFLPPAFACWKNYEARRAVIFIRRVVVPALMVPALAFALDACAQLGSNSSSVNTVASADNSAPQSTLLAHHEIKPSNLPPPKLENDVDNPPRVVAQPQGANLNLPPGFETSTFAEGGFQRPRWMALAPNGDVFLADADLGKIFILRDTNGDGVSDQRFTFAEGLNKPFGMAFWRDYFYVGNTNGIVRFHYKSGQTKADGPPEHSVQRRRRKDVCHGRLRIKRQCRD